MISNQPYKGTQDYYPTDYVSLRYLFETWRATCLKFGYKEYQTPLVELAELYRAKSGEDVGGKELYTLKDLSDRELAIRPEMTPSVTRMVSRIYKEYPKPIRLFNISNFMRYEKPQKGRNREFWQLNADIFGTTTIEADLEILVLALEIMLAFNPPANSFVLYINDRNLIEDFICNELKINDKSLKAQTVRKMDKYDKFASKEEYETYLREDLTQEQAIKIISFLSTEFDRLPQMFPDIKESGGYKSMMALLNSLKKLGYAPYVQFSNSIIRGFDYYDGMIFEVFDTNKENSRSLFGGGRYNGLASLFGSENIPAVGFAPGNETLLLFLKNWNLLPETNINQNTVYFPTLLNDTEANMNATMALRKKGYYVEQDFRQGNETYSINEGLRNANKRNFPLIALFGAEEAAESVVKVKNLDTGEQETIKIA